MPTAADGMTSLAHELVSPRGAWVKIPKLTASTETRFYVYYGNPTYAQPAPGAQVWDGQYEAVWHLDEAVAPYRDSTSRHQDGSSNATTAIAGQIANAQLLTGTSEIIFPMSSAIGITDMYSLSTWFWLDTLDAVIAHGSIGLTLTFEVSQSGTISGIAYEGCGSANWPANKVSGAKKASAGRWMYGTLRLGPAVCGNAGVKGRIDEVRLTKRPLDDAWLRAELESQSSPSTFATILPDEQR